MSVEQLPVQSTQQSSLHSIQLAAITKGVFDIPPRTRRLLSIAGLCGIIIVIVASLQGNRPATIEVDKVLHFSGYFVLAFILVLGLSPKYYVPALLTLIGLGYLIEVVQPLNGRSRDIEDFFANTIGVGVGTFAGLIARGIYAFLKKEIAAIEVRRRLRNYSVGETILSEGAQTSRLFVIESGSVKLTKQFNGKSKDLTTLGPGDVIGLLGAIQGTPQYSTATAVSRTSIYGMDLSELMDSAGGVKHPVALVLSTFADKTRELVERVHELESESVDPEAT